MSSAMPLNSMDRHIVELLWRTPKATQARLARELKNDENSGWVTKRLRKALDPKDRDAVEV